QLLAALGVRQGDGGPEDHLVAGELGRVDHVGERELGLDLADARLGQALLLLGGVVVGVLAEVAVAARLFDQLRDARALGLELGELFLEAGVPARGHRDLLVHALYSWSDRTSIAPRCSLAIAAAADRAAAIVVK